MPQCSSNLHPFTSKADALTIQVKVQTTNQLATDSPHEAEGISQYHHYKDVFIIHC